MRMRTCNHKWASACNVRMRTWWASACNHVAFAYVLPAFLGSVSFHTWLSAICTSHIAHHNASNNSACNVRMRTWWASACNHVAFAYVLPAFLGSVSFHTWLSAICTSHIAHHNASNNSADILPHTLNRLTYFPLTLLLSDLQGGPTGTI